MKKTILFTVIIFLLLSNITSVFASGFFSGADDFIETGITQSTGKIDVTKLKTTSQEIFNVLFLIGIGAAFIVGTILGVQFMTAGIDQKVKVKESLVAYTVSCVILFGAFGIWKLAVIVLNSF